MLTKQRTLVFEEKDMGIVVRAINLAYRTDQLITLGMIDSKKNDSPWYVDFMTTEKKWNKIVDMLMETGSISYIDIPDYGKELFYQ